MVSCGIYFIWLAVMILGFSRGLKPKCECGKRMEIINVEKISEKKTGWFGIKYTTYYSLVTYRCPKCGKKIVKKETMQYTRSGGVFVLAGGGNGGFSGGGFGGGGSGGGGAGR